MKPPVTRIKKSSEVHGDHNFCTCCHPVKKSADMQPMVAIMEILPCFLRSELEVFLKNTGVFQGFSKASTP